jgi:5-hydroxyisourate hydrolase-like protein (transthyretin family)
VAHPDDGGEVLPIQGQIDGDAFSVLGLEPGSYEVRFALPGYLPASLDAIALAPGDHLRDLSIQLEKGRTVGGTVRDDQGEPVSGVEISIQRMDGDRFEQVGRSDSSGRFAISGLSPGSYVVTSKSVGFRVAPSVGPLSIGERDLTDVDVVLSPLGRISVELSPGNQEAAVFAVPESTGLSDSKSTFGWIAGQRDDDGSFSIQGLPEGTYYIAVTAPGHVLTYFPGTSNPDDASTITALDGEITEADPFGIIKGSTLSGHMGTRDLNEPISGAVVEIISLDRREVFSVVTDNDGRYELSCVGAGQLSRAGQG